MQANSLSLSCCANVTKMLCCETKLPHKVVTATKSFAVEYMRYWPCEMLQADIQDLWFLTNMYIMEVLTMSSNIYITVYVIDKI